MTNDATYREKGRALFLAAMMVLSVVAMSAAFAGAAAAVNEDNVDDGPTYSDANNIDEVWIGQEVTIEGGINDGYIGIGEGPTGDGDDTIMDENVDSGPSVTIDTSDLEAGNTYHIFDFDAGTDGEVVTAFEAEYEDLDVEFSSDSVSDEGTVTLDFESDRDRNSQLAAEDGHLSSSVGQTQDVNVSADGIDGDDLNNIISINNGADNVEHFHDGENVTLTNVDDEADFDFNFNQADVDTGEYVFYFNVTDSMAAATVTLEVTDADEDRYVLDNDDPEQGDIANVTIGVEETDEAIVTLGDYQEDGHASIIAVENIEHDNVTLQYNTFNAHENNAWSLYDDDEADLVGSYTHSDLDSSSEILPAGSWSLGVGTYDPDEVADIHAFDLTEVEDLGDYDAYDQDDRDNMVISDRSAPGDIVTQTAAEDYSVTSLDNYNDAHVTATETIATQEGDDDEVGDEGDSLFLSVDDFGGNGSIDLLGSDPSGVDLYNDAGISIEIVEQDSGAVGSPTTWNTSYDVGDHHEDLDNGLPVELYTVEDDYEGELIFVINYNDLEGQSISGDQDEFELDETYNIYFNITESETVLFDESYSDSGELTFEEPEVEWDEIDEIGNSSEATATGTTNVAPGTILDADADSDEGNFIETTDANVSDDGTFEAVFDLGDEELGVMMDLSVEEPLAGEDDELEDVRLVQAEDDDDDDEDEPEEGLDLSVDYDDIEEGDTAEIDATVDNHGENETTVDVVLEIDGEAHEESFEIDGGDSASHTFAVENLSVGDYDFTVTVEDDEFDEEYDGTISVSEEGVPDDDDDDADAPEDDDDDDDDDDGTPGFGVAVALVALLSAAMLALRRQD
ncbi:BGTF surface domain-containing protein [Halostagnicola bangensis]